jgi:hypothetical protein
MFVPPVTIPWHILKFWEKIIKRRKNNGGKA